MKEDVEALGTWAEFAPLPWLRLHLEAPPSDPPRPAALEQRRVQRTRAEPPQEGGSHTDPPQPRRGVGHVVGVLRRRRDDHASTLSEGCQPTLRLGLTLALSADLVRRKGAPEGCDAGHVPSAIFRTILDKNIGLS